MAIQTLLRALRRGDPSSGEEVALQADVSRNFLVAQGGPAYGEAARAGGIWTVMGAAVAPLVAVPTTTAALEVYNNSNSGMVMEILDVFYFHLLATAKIFNVTLFAQVCAPKAAPSTGSLVVASNSGRGKYTDTATTRVTTGTSVTVIANGWRPWGNPIVPSTHAALPGSGMHAEVNGKLLVPPGCSIALHTTSEFAEGTVQCGVTWNERVGMTAVA